MPGDPWANTEFHVKWKRYAYIQCSWDTRATLSQLGGYKRIINYMKRWDDLQVGSSACNAVWLKKKRKQHAARLFIKKSLGYTQASLVCFSAI